MAVNKVIYDGSTLIDLTGDTATASDVASGKTFHLANGTQAIGTASGGGDTYKTGTVSFSTTYSSTGNREIVSLSTIGFTPKRFYLIIRDKSVVSGKQYAVLRASFETSYDNTYLRTTTRYSKADNTFSTSQNDTSWTTQSNYYLYTDGSNVYLRTTNTFIIFTGTSYDWIAIP